ncbi:MAG: flagellar filament capping protein FliD [Betaproteobacteria bacterium]|jgi:flagellar hook-associated protein 2
MATSSLSGSGLDVNAIVSQLMTFERRPLAALTQREVEATSRISALSRLQGGVSALQRAAATLSRSSTFTSMRATAAGDGVAAAVTDSTVAVAGTYQVKVTGLASAHALASQAFAANEAIGTGTLTIRLGSVSGNAFTPTANSSAIPITITEANNTLAGIRDAINAAKVGVTASVVTDNAGSRLTLLASDTGRSNTILVDVDDASDGSNTNNQGLSRLSFDPTQTLPSGDTTGAGRQLLETRAPLDATFEVNGLALTSSSNKATAAISGVTLDLRKASADAVTTVNVERDTQSIRGAIDSFIKAYNDVDKVLRDVSAYDPVNRKAGVLNGDSAVRSIQSQLRGLLGAQMSASIGDFTTLSAVGIQFGKDGSLSLSTARFDAALADTGKLSRLFTATSDTIDSARGFGVRFEAFGKQIAGTDGVLPSRTSSQQTRIDAIAKQKIRLNDRFDDIERRLRQQYASLDSQLSKMQGTSTSLASALSQLPRNG